MKILKHICFPFLIIGISLSGSTFFQSCKPDDVLDEDETCDTCILVYKPNIYIYPEEKSTLFVSLDFPQGGKIVASAPEYGNGWDIFVDTNGKINGEFDYLFYESSQPDVWQHEKGWVVERDELHDFFIENMSEYGFSEKEIQDFTEYWIPRLKASEFYAIYPQGKNLIDRVIELNTSKEPDNILRLFYVIQETKELVNSNLQEPEIEQFSREGFFISEWGVVLK